MKQVFAIISLTVFIYSCECPRNEGSWSFELNSCWSDFIGMKDGDSLYYHRENKNDTVLLLVHNIGQDYENEVIPYSPCGGIINLQYQAYRFDGLDESLFVFYRTRDDSYFNDIVLLQTESKINQGRRLALFDFYVNNNVSDKCYFETRENTVRFDTAIILGRSYSKGFVNSDSSLYHPDFGFLRFFKDGEMYSLVNK